MITVLAENHLAYRGTLTEMCEFIGVRSRDTRTNQKIKEAVEALEIADFIKIIRDGRTWTLTLSKRAERKSRVIQIRKDWVLAMKACKGQGVDWSIVLKVWLFLKDSPKDIFTSYEIANALGTSISQVESAKKVLRDLNAIHSKPVIEKIPDGSYFCKGSNILLSAWITD